MRHRHSSQQRELRRARLVHIQDMSETKTLSALGTSFVNCIAVSLSKTSSRFSHTVFPLNKEVYITKRLTANNTLVHLVRRLLLEEEFWERFLNGNIFANSKQTNSFYFKMMCVQDKTADEIPFVEVKVRFFFPVMQITNDLLTFYETCGG